MLSFGLRFGIIRTFYCNLFITFLIWSRARFGLEYKKLSQRPPPRVWSLPNIFLNWEVSGQFNLGWGVAVVDERVAWRRKKKTADTKFIADARIIVFLSHLWLAPDCSPRTVFCLTNLLGWRSEARHYKTFPWKKMKDVNLLYAFLYYNEICLIALTHQQQFILPTMMALKK